MIIEIHYPAGHTITEEWKLCDLLCPSCGNRYVWVEQGEGDYYQGPEYICVKCGEVFTIQGPYKITRDHIGAFRVLEVLRSDK